jgi:hypothetical protein
VARFEWEVRGDGVVIERRFAADGSPAIMRPGLPFYETHLHYGPGGWLALMSNRDANGALVRNDLNAAQDRIDVDIRGGVLGWNVLDETGALVRGNAIQVARGVIERDERGYEITERFEDETGAPIESAYGWAYTRASYDRFGNRNARANYTLDGRTPLVSARRGYASYRATFDASGRNRTRLAFFGADDAPAVVAGRGYAEVRMAYNARDNLIATTFHGLNGEPIARADTSVARIAHIYDTRGRRIETRFLDLAGALTNDLATGYAREERAYGAHGVPTSVRRFSADGRPIVGGGSAAH